MNKFHDSLEVGSTHPDTFTHTPDYRPQTGELIAVRDYNLQAWYIRQFVGFIETSTKLGKARRVLTLSDAGDGRYVEWEQHAPITQNEQTEPELTFDSVVKTLLEANVVRAVEYMAAGNVCILARHDATEDKLQEALDIVKMDQIREQALAKLSEVERKALGL